MANVIQTAIGYDPDGNKIIAVEKITPLQKLRRDLRQCQTCHGYFTDRQCPSQHCISCLHECSTTTTIEFKHKKQT